MYHPLSIEGSANYWPELRGLGQYDNGHTDADGYVSLFTNEDGLLIDKVYINGDEVSVSGRMFPGDRLSLTI